MKEDMYSKKLFRIGGVAGIAAVVFIPAIIIQTATGWFPEDALQSGTMTEWLASIATQKAAVLSGIGIFILFIIMMPIVGAVLYTHLRENSPLAPLALGLNLSGALLAIAAFCFAYGFTWALVDMTNSSSHDPTAMAALATMGMRGFLISDDLATCLIGISNALFSAAAVRAGLLPKWILIWATAGAFLVTIVLLRYIVPAFTFGVIGYPITALWYVLTGILLLRRSAAIG